MQNDRVSVNLAVEFPPAFSFERTCRLLESCQLVEWSWDQFLWDVRRLLHLLTTSPATFDYAYVIRFLKARAAHLLLDESRFSCEHREVLTGLGEKRVQFPWIYCELLIEALKDVAEGRANSRVLAPGNGRLFQLAFIEIEARYLDVVQVVCVSGNPREVIHNRDAETWTTGTRANSDGTRTSVIHCPVAVGMNVEVKGRYRHVRACGEEMIAKIKAKDPIREYSERFGCGAMADLEMERLSRHGKVDGFWTLRFGRREIQFFKTLTNERKDTLYVICADRTMKIHQADGVPPASIPKAIESAYSGRENCGYYMVQFDNGVIGVFVIEFRAHKDNEEKWVPVGICRRREGPLLLNAARHGDGQGTEAEAPAEAAGGRGEDAQAQGQTEAKPAAGGSQGPATAQRPQVEVGPEYRWLKVDGVEIDFSRKKKRREFVQFVHQRRIKTGEDVFEYGKIVHSLGEQSGRAIESERFEEDLFKGQSREFRLLFAVVDKKRDKYRIRI